MSGSLVDYHYSLSLLDHQNAIRDGAEGDSPHLAAIFYHALSHDHVHGIHSFGHPLCYWSYLIRRVGNRHQSFLEARICFQVSHGLCRVGRFQDGAGSLASLQN